MVENRIEPHPSEQPNFCKCLKCGYTWKSRKSLGDKPSICPNCYAGPKYVVALAGVSPSGVPIMPGSQAPQMQQSQQPGGYAQQPAQYMPRQAAEALESDEKGMDPQEEFISILKDVGLKNRTRVITEIIFQGQPENPKWVNSVLRDGGIDVVRRKLILMRQFGKRPELLGIKEFVGGSTGDDLDDTNSGDVDDKDDDNESSIDNEMKKIQKQRITEMKDRLAERKLNLLEERLAREKPGQTSSDSKQGGEDKIEIPVFNDKGEMMMDKEGKPVFMKATATQLFYMNMAKANKKEDKSDQPSHMETFLSGQYKFMQEQNASRDKELTILREQSSAQQAKLLEGMFKLREGIMRRELDDTRGQIRGPEDWLKTIKTYVELGKEMGMVKTGEDPKQSSIRETREVLFKRFDGAEKQVSWLMERAAEYVKEERSFQRGTVGKKAPPLTDDEKQQFYLRGAEDYKQAVIAQQEQAKLEEARLAANPLAPASPPQSALPESQSQPAQIVQPQNTIAPQGSQIISQIVPERTGPPVPSIQESGWGNPAATPGVIFTLHKGDDAVKPEPPKVQSTVTISTMTQPVVVTSTPTDMLVPPAILQSSWSSTPSEPQKVVQEQPVEEKEKEKKWGADMLTDDIMTNPLDQIDAEHGEQEKQSSQQSEPENYRFVGDPGRGEWQDKDLTVDANFKAFIDRIIPKANAGNDGLVVDFDLSVPKTMDIDAGHGTRAEIGIKYGVPFVKKLIFSKDVSQNDAQFWVDHAIEDMKKGTCPICKKARDILRKSGKGYLLKEVGG